MCCVVRELRETRCSWREDDAPLPRDAPLSASWGLISSSLFAPASRPLVGGVGSLLPKASLFWHCQLVCLENLLLLTTAHDCADAERMIDRSCIFKWANLNLPDDGGGGDDDGGSGGRGGGGGSGGGGGGSRGRSASGTAAKGASSL